MTVLVGGVGQLYQGDFDLGRHAVEILAGEDLGAGVVVEDLHYGAVAVAQRLEDLQPAALVLVGAAERGRPAAALERRRIRGIQSPAEELQRAVGEAVTGYVTIDLVLEVAVALGALPARTVTIEVEPLLRGPADRLSPEVKAVLGDAVRLVREETRRAALLVLADQARSICAADTTALEPLAALLAELEVVDDQGRWGRTFALGDRVRDWLAGDPSGDELGAECQALAWAVVEELGRLRRGVAGYEIGQPGDMEENIREDRDEEREHAEDLGSLRRTTEQGDELTEEHSLSMREHRATTPYTRPRQPAQDPPSS